MSGRKTKGWAEIIRPHKEVYFAPLCRKLGLSRVEDAAGKDLGYETAEGGHVRVHFQHDYGICHLAIGSSAEKWPLCSVEEMATRFPRVRASSDGIQRLSLEEQRQFVEDHWHDLQLMFSPDHLVETRRWRQAQIDAWKKELQGGS